VLAVLVAIEKLAPFGAVTAKVLGALLVCAGLALIATG
jgi:predicted metal-binding membrane protein